MEKISKSLKEWNAVVEALGRGKQSIIIRKYGTKNKEFFLNPTLKYALKDDYLKSFQNKHQQFVEKYKYPEKENDKVVIKYFAICEEIIEKSSNRIGSLKNQYIWNPDHIHEYLKGRDAYIWLLRVYKLKKSHNIESTPNAIIFANLKEHISVSGAKPVLNDKEFKKILKTII